MSPSVFRAAALVLLAGVACSPALAQSSGNSGNSGIDSGALEELLPGEITPLPQGEEPAVRRRKPRDVTQPGPDTNAPPPAIDGTPIVEGNGPQPQPEEQPRRKRRQQPGGDTNELPRARDGVPRVEPGPIIIDPDPGVEPEPRPRRRPRNEFTEPGPDTNELPRARDGVPRVDDGEPHRRRPRYQVYEEGPGPNFSGPSADQIERQLEARPRIRLAPGERVTIREFQRRPDLRRAAPSIDIQAINFTSGSAEIPVSQYRKVENIAIALERLLRRDPDTLVLIEGHTDAVGSFASNQVLSERRAASLKRVLVREFGVPRDALETVGYGEQYLLIPTTRENWKNRRVTLRVVNDFVR